MSAGQVSISENLDAIGHLSGLYLQTLIVIAIILAIHVPICVSILCYFKIKKVDILGVDISGS